jgi:crotonobetainyl-CoA:carnitine CoA-transferase CaiB-like acyl-CoA transferase
MRGTGGSDWPPGGATMGWLHRRSTREMEKLLMSSTPLDGLRVVDLTTGIAGAVATMHFADFGASVLKIEPQQGDPTRAEPGFAMWARGKRSTVLDLGTPTGRAALAALLGDADVVVTNDEQDDFGGLSLSELSTNARLVVLRMPPYAGAPPWSGRRESNELLSAAMGVSLRQSSFEDAPVDPVYPHLVYEQGIWAAACAVAALTERERSGLGQTVTVSGPQGALVAGTATFLVDTTKTGAAPPAGPGGPNAFYTRYQCGDGQWLFLGSLTAKFQYRALEALGLTGMLDDPRLGGSLDGALQPEARDWLRASITETFRGRPRAEWLEALEKADCPAGPLGDRDEWLDHPQIRAIGMRVEVSDPERGDVVMPGIPLVLTATPGSVRSPAPQLGETASPAWDERPAPGGTPSPLRTGTGPGPLAGVRVLDLGTILAGPLAGSLLAELGADVLKIEPPEGDSFRVTGFIYNKGMRSISIDLRSAEGKSAFYDLVRSADVVIDNYRLGVLSRLSIDHESLVAVNPDIITLSISGYGEGGPMSAKPGFDPILQGLSGMMAAQGGDSEPYFLTLAINDATAGAMSALGTCLGLLHRARTGVGQRIWTSLAGLSAFMQSGELTRFEGRAPARSGGRDNPGPTALDRFYPSSDGWVRLQAQRSDVPALHSAGVLANSDTNADATTDLVPELSAWFAARTRDAAVAALSGLGVPATAARAIPELVQDAQLMAAQTLELHHLPTGAAYYTPSRYAAFDRTPQTSTLIAPGMGEHTRELLSELGYPGDRIQSLIDSGAVIDGEPLVLRGFVSYR